MEVNYNEPSISVRIPVPNQPKHLVHFKDPRFLTRFWGGLLNKSSHSAAALGVTKFIVIIAMNLVTLFVLLKSNLDVQQSHFWGWFIEQKLMLNTSLRCDQSYN